MNVLFYYTELARRKKKFEEKKCRKKFFDFFSLSPPGYTHEWPKKKIQTINQGHGVARGIKKIF